MYKPVFRITPYLLNLIDEAGKLRSIIENETIKVPWLPALQKEALRKATHSSTSIEGNPLNLNDVKAIDLGEKTGKPSLYEKEVENYLAGLRFVEKHSKSKINEKNVLFLHKTLTNGILPESASGKYKEKQNYIINEKGITIYTPPSPKETPGLTQSLLDWLETKEAINLHGILVCAIFHHRLVSIHPFVDGNGRMARIIGTWILYQKSFDIKHIFSLDDFFAADRKRYYQKIEQARELDDDLTYWIEYVAEGIISTLKDVTKRIKDLQVSSKYEIRLTSRQEDLIKILRDNRSCGVNELQKTLSLTRSRINQILRPLIKNGLITKEGESRATRYKLSI